MVFVSYLLFLKLFKPGDIKQIQDTVTLNPDESDNYGYTVLKSFLTFSLICIMVLLTVVPAVIIAISCNKGTQAIISGLTAFFFSDIYLFNYALRKFVYKEVGYCN